VRGNVGTYLSRQAQKTAVVSITPTDTATTGQTERRSPPSPESAAGCSRPFAKTVRIAAPEAARGWAQAYAAPAGPTPCMAAPFVPERRCIGMPSFCAMIRA